MAKFEEEKVINALHPERAEVGKKYWFADSISFLKNSVESDLDNIFVLGNINYGNYPFEEEGNNGIRQFLYPYEEPPKQRMTGIQLMEWLSKGNGLFKYNKGSVACYDYGEGVEEELNDEVDEDIVIRTWDSEEWIEPTVDIYERDCKGVNK